MLTVSAYCRCKQQGIGFIAKMPKLNLLFVLSSEHSPEIVINPPVQHTCQPSACQSNARLTQLTSELANLMQHTCQPPTCHFDICLIKPISELANLMQHTCQPPTCRPGARQCNTPASHQTANLISHPAGLFILSANPPGRCGQRQQLKEFQPTRPAVQGITNQKT